MEILLWTVVALLVLAFLYWLIVVGEATYLGRPAVRLLYQFGARFYDEARTGVTASDAEVLAPLFCAALQHVPAPQVLDVATGTGRVPLLIASQPWFSGHVVGLDCTPAMLERARAKASAAGLQGRIELRSGDAGQLPWPDNSFDLVTSLEALEFFPRPRRALDEMIRALKPGGTLIVSKYPDRWARVLPFKGLTRRSMARYLHARGLRRIRFREWQPGHYELVIAVKIEP